MKEISLNAALEVLKETYQGIDLRALLARATADSQWQCIVLKVRLTKEPTKEIRARQLKGEICNVSNDLLRIAFESRKISELDSILEDVEKGVISLKEAQAGLIGYGHEKIREREIINDPGYSTLEEMKGFRNKAGCTSMAETPLVAIEKLIRNRVAGTNIEEFKYCLDMPALVNTTNVVILLPLYCKRLPLLSKERGKYLTRFQTHKSLSNRIKSKIRVYPEGRIGESPQIKLVDLERPAINRNQMVITRLPLKHAIRDGDYIEVDILESTMHSVLISDHLWASEVLPEKKSKFWLNNVLERIDRNLGTLEGWIQGENKGEQQGDFERAVCMLFSVCGLVSVHVGDDYETQTLQIRRNTHKKSSISTDIVMSHPLEEDDTIFLCQCTREWKKDDKFDDILNFTRELRGMSGKTKIKPVLVTRLERAKISEYEATATRRGVKVLTINDLMSLLNRVRQNVKPDKLIKSLLS